MTRSAVDSSTQAGGLSDQERKKKKAHRKLLGAGLLGSSIEWYDFFLYGTAAALVFPHVFFPDSSALMGTLLSFSTFWAGFVARPIGGLVAGHFGDKYGRKPAVVTCLLLMAVATFLIGAIPSASAIGVVAPILLVTLRFIQGLACGGQWGGIVLLLTESASPKKRGFSGTFGQMGVSFGVVLGNLVFLVATATISNEAFLSWGWRVPFFASALLFPVVLYIQTKVEDTPEFLELQEDAKKNQKDVVVQAPLAQALKDHWRKILLGCGLLAATNGTVLHQHRRRAQLRHNRTGVEAELTAHHLAPECVADSRCGAVVREDVRQDRSSSDDPDRRRGDRGLGIPVLLVDQHQVPAAVLHRGDSRQRVPVDDLRADRCVHG